jgi:hypothetical protein
MHTACCLEGATAELHAFARCSCCPHYVHSTNQKEWSTPFVQEECMRRGIDPSDMAAVREMVMHGKGNIYGGGNDERSTNHPSQQVPRFGSDLGFSARGVQVRAPQQCSAP